MNFTKGKELLLWIMHELKTLAHGEIHITIKVRDSRVAIIEKTKIIKEKPE